MKKFFMALMAVAAITFTACEPQNTPDKPNNGNKDEEKIGAVVIAAGFSMDWLKIADVCFYDSISGEAAKQEPLTTLYGAIIIDPVFPMVAKYQAQTEAFEGGIECKGFYLKMNLSSKKEFGVRCEIKIKDNYMEILKAMDQDGTLRLLGFTTGDMQTSAPVFIAGNGHDSTYTISKLVELLESKPDWLKSNAELTAKTLSQTFTTTGHAVGTK